MKVEEYLNNISYKEDTKYIPSIFALQFINFIKLVNGEQGEEHKTPVIHYKMLDKLATKSKKNTINMLFRGSAKALALDTIVYTPSGISSIEKINIGDLVLDRFGLPTKVIAKSKIFNKTSYKVILDDHREFIVCEDHLNIVERKSSNNIFKEEVLTIPEILSKGLYFNRTITPKQTTGKEYKWFIPQTPCIQYPKSNFPIDPYTVGVILGDGNIDKNSGYTRIHSHILDVHELVSYIPYNISEIKSDKRRPETVRFGLLKLGNLIKTYIGTNNTYLKKIPKELLFGSIEERLEILRGLMDTDGTISKNKGTNPSFTSVSEELANDVATLVRGLGGRAKITKQYSEKFYSYRVGISISFNPFKLKRKANLWKPKEYKRIGIKSIELIDTVPTQCIAVESESKSFLINGYTITHNTTLMAEYLILYIATYGEIDGFGKIPLGIYVSDSIENGVKNMRKNLEYRWDNSEFLKQVIPNTRFTDIRWEFQNVEGLTTIFKGYGAKALSLDSKLFTNTGFTTIGDCSIGDKIFAADGTECVITAKSEVFNKPMYEIILEDGRSLKVSEDHLNSVVVKENFNNKSKYERKVLTTKELLQLPLYHSRQRITKNKLEYVSNEKLVFIENCKPVQFTEKELLLDPYTLGLLLGDGSLRKDGSCVLTGIKEDIDFYSQLIPYELGNQYLDKRTTSVITVSVKGISQRIRDLKVNCHGNIKFIPKQYLFSSIEQRIALLQGLMDTDGSIQHNGRMDFCSNSEQLVDDVSFLVRSLGGTTKKRIIKNAFRIEIWIDIPIFKLPRKFNRFGNNKDKSFVGIISINKIANEPSQCIAIDNPEHEFITESFIRTHNTGVRGTKELGQRPYLAILDDLISDEDARSDTVIKSVEDTVHKAIKYALHPSRNKVIWNGTPFNANDPLYKAIESGVYDVNVFPVCEQFPCTKEEFRGAWEDRFSYDYVKQAYDDALKLGKIDTFNQELMLRIMSDEDRLINDSDIRWYKRDSVLDNKNIFNFYISTDFATKEKESNDFSVISVWAYNANGDWFWVDGICKRQTMKYTVDDLFRLVSMYKPQGVGIETNGQQYAFIDWLQSEMMRRNIWFTFESNSTEPGIKSKGNKFERFKLVEPWFKLHKFYFPIEMKTSEALSEGLNELMLVSKSGFKSKHDDFCDSISQLAFMNPWKPSEDIPIKEDHDRNIWEIDIELPKDNYSSYIV